MSSECIIQPKNIECVNLEEVWQNGKYLQDPAMIHIIEMINKHYGYDQSESYIDCHLGEYDCMYDDGEFEECDAISKLDINNLGYYFMPHGCNTNTVFMFVYLGLAYPEKNIQIIYIHDHFVCAEIGNIIKIYDMTQYAYENIIGEDYEPGAKRFRKKYDKGEYIKLDNKTVKKYLSKNKVYLYDIHAIRHFLFKK